MSDRTRRLTTLAMLTALSIILVAVIRIPWPALPFLEYDPADIPILLGALLYGPLWGLGLTAVVSALQALTVSAASGWMGFIMHFLATGALSVVVGLLYRTVKWEKDSPERLSAESAAGTAHAYGACALEKKGRPALRALVALIAGAATMVLVMVPLNLIVTPFFTGSSVESVKEMILPFIVPFNCVKAGANSAVAYLLYLGLRATPLRDRL